MASREELRQDLKSKLDGMSIEAVERSLKLSKFLGATGSGDVGRMRDKFEELVSAVEAEQKEHDKKKLEITPGYHLWRLGKKEAEALVSERKAAIKVEGNG